MPRIVGELPRIVGKSEHFFTYEVADLSRIGLNQAMSGEIITSPTDRQAVAGLLQLVASSTQAIAGIRHEQLNNKYAENMR